MTFISQMTIACRNSNNTDDLLAAMQLFLQQVENQDPLDGRPLRRKVEQNFLIAFYEALGVNLYQAFDAQAENILRNQLLQKCFSMQAAISYKGEKEDRILTSKIAWTLLNLRQVALCFAFAFANRTNPDLSKPGRCS